MRFGRRDGRDRLLQGVRSRLLPAQGGGGRPRRHDRKRDKVRLAAHVRDAFEQPGRGRYVPPRYAVGGGARLACQARGHRGRRSRDSQRHRQDGVRHCRRYGDDDAACCQGACRGLPGDERQHVRERSGAGQHRAAQKTRLFVRRGGRGLPRLRRRGQGQARRARSHRPKGRRHADARQGLLRQESARHRRRDARGRGRHTLFVQLFQRQDGRRDRQGGQGQRGRGHSRRRLHDGARSRLRRQGRQGDLDAADV